MDKFLKVGLAGIQLLSIGKGQEIIIPLNYRAFEFFTIFKSDTSELVQKNNNIIVSLHLHSSVQKPIMVPHH